MIFRKILFLFSVPFSFLYFFIITLRNVFYVFNIFRKYKINAKVISVGNVTWGGTGKTPVVAFIADILAKKNYKVSILIRGYGNDESELLPKLTSNAPVLVGKDRVARGLEAIEKNLSDTILLDDGFQYARLRRDLDIVCVDAAKPFGNGWVIPAGILREGLGSLKRADIFLITKADLVSSKDKLEKLERKLRSINPRAIIVKAIHRPLYFYRLLDKVGDGRDRPLLDEKVHPVRDNLPKTSYQGISNGVNIGELKNKEIALVSAIGSPECFEKTVLRLGLKINKHFVFRDHHNYTKEDIVHIEDYCRKNNLDTLITTEKDAVKLKGLQSLLRSLSTATPLYDGVANFSSRKHERRLKPATPNMDGATPDLSSEALAKEERARYALQFLVLKVRLEIIENENGFYNRLFGIYSS